MSEYVFGADVGGTAIKLGLFTTGGELLDKWSIETTIDNQGERILPDIAYAVGAKMNERRLTLRQVAGIGVGIPGAVKNASYVAPCVNLNQWGDFDVAQALTELTHLPARVENDANAAGLGEVWQGGAKGVDNAVFVTLGTGVGGGIIHNGRIVSGAHGAGGEIGHIKMFESETFPCGCGSRGCLEQYGSATGLVKSARDRLEASDRDTSLRGIAHLTAKDIFDAAKAGDMLAIELIDQFAGTLARALAIISCVCDPRVFIIGGGIASAGAFLLDRMQDAFQNYVFPAARSTEIRLAKLGNDAGIYGAAKLILDEETR